MAVVWRRVFRGVGENIPVVVVWMGIFQWWWCGWEYSGGGGVDGNIPVVVVWSYIAGPHVMPSGTSYGTRWHDMVTDTVPDVAILQAPGMA